MKRRAVFLDRDGVLNRIIVKGERRRPPTSAAEVEILPGVLEVLPRLKNAGFVLIVVSNQPDVARGITPRAAVEEINDYLSKRMPIDRFMVCFHDTPDGCDCRKPGVGMLLAGAREFDVDLASSYMVGDRWRDMEAGVNAGCRTIFMDHGYDEKQPEFFHHKVSSFLEVEPIVLKDMTLSPEMLPGIICVSEEKKTLIQDGSKKRVGLDAPDGPSQ